jgi:transposase
MDKAYEGAQTRQALWDKGMIPVVPPKLNRKTPWEYDETLYRRNNVFSILPSK